MNKWIMAISFFTLPICALDYSRIATNLLCFEAKRWIDVKEEADNKGAFVEMFQKAVDGVNADEPWCMAYIQFCLMKAEECFIATFPDAAFKKSKIYRSEHCLETWNKSREQKSATPGKGYFCVWQRYNNGIGTAMGHAGIVVEVNGNRIKVIEANTFPQRASGDIERNGSGVYLKEYTVGEMTREPLRFKGFLRVWE